MREHFLNRKFKTQIAFLRCRSPGIATVEDLHLRLEIIVRTYGLVRLKFYGAGGESRAHNNLISCLSPIEKKSARYIEASSATAYPRLVCIEKREITHSVCIEVETADFIWL